MRFCLKQRVILERIVSAVSNHGYFSIVIKKINILYIKGWITLIQYLFFTPSESRSLFESHRNANFGSLEDGRKSGEGKSYRSIPLRCGEYGWGNNS